MNQLYEVEWDAIVYQIQISSILAKKGQTAQVSLVFISKLNTSIIKFFLNGNNDESNMTNKCKHGIVQSV